MPCIWKIVTDVLEELDASTLNFFLPEGEGSTVLQNIGKHLPDYSILFYSLFTSRKSYRRKQSPQI
jgi:hypothetical protein